MLSWSFEFEDKDYFEGFRSLATNGIDKPVLNVFRMFGMMSGERVKTSSTGEVPLDTLVGTGVRGTPDVDAFATHAAKEAAVLVWNYHDVEPGGSRNAHDSDRPRHSGRRAARAAGALPYRPDAQQRVHGVAADGLAATSDG